MDVKFENKEICSKCGGRCCKKCGCDYAPSDFESMSIDYLQKKLEEGNISIVSTLFFDVIKNKQIVCVPFLFLRARNTDRPIVDLVSMKTQCSLLKIDGCPYNYKNRPAGARNVIPKEDFLCDSYTNPNELIIEPWSQYQKILSRLVKRMTGYSVDEKVSMDIKKLFEDIMECNFKGVSKESLIEVMELLPLIAEVYDDELKQVLNKYSHEYKIKSIFTKVLINKIKNRIK